jgi:hypothetical protein
MGGTFPGPAYAFIAEILGTEVALIAALVIAT